MKVPHNTITDFGNHEIIVKRIADSDTSKRVVNPHRDNYYIFCLLKRGDATFRVDFEEVAMTGGSVLCILPDQIHAFGSTESGIEGFALIADEAMVCEEYGMLLTEYGHGSPAATDDARTRELEALAEIIERRTGDGSATAKRIVREAADAAIGVFVEAICGTENRRRKSDRRRLEIFIRFRKLLRESLHLDRRPSFYADALHISTGYLNEIVTATADLSTSRYIRKEIILQAKRMLVYTTLDIGEIAARLGFDDCAYFTRMFTAAAGISPTLFRRNYRE